MEEKEQQAGRLAGAFAEIKKIPNQSILREPWLDYFTAMAGFMGQLEEACGLVESGELRRMRLEELQAHNHALYGDILPEHYGESYANPAFAVNRLGKSTGQFLSFLYAELRSAIPAAYEGRREAVLMRAEFLLEVYRIFVCAAQGKVAAQRENDAQGDSVAKEKGQAPEMAALLRAGRRYVEDHYEAALTEKLEATLDAEQDFARRILMESDLADLRYLYYFGEYVTENELRTAAHLQQLPEEKIRLMADTCTEGYRIGFQIYDKDISRKKTVMIQHCLGFERMVRQAVENFDRIGLQSSFCRAQDSIFHGRSVYKSGYCGANPNRQFDYDHREDMALFLDEELGECRLAAARKVFARLKEQAALYGGPAVVEVFGEEPFAPVAKDAACSLSESQRKLSVSLAGRMSALQNEYMPREERSFTIIAFPTPQIGARYGEIFDEVVEINTLDYMLYRNIQQTIIDALDKGSTVLVKGKGGNETDIKVQLHPLTDPQTQTNFENCVADVNIPVGEVFTSPLLTGTEGLLHVSRVFLNGLEYRDLRLSFRDGFVTDYACGNFQDKEEGRKYIRDNVLFHHDALPLGEFAIGTNTRAYRAARKYHIEDKLPILIAEKMGPHFALGDTCYSHEENLRLYNPDGKEIIAKDNEVSALRDTDVSKAYFQCHTDITLPYDELGEIAVLTGTGEKIFIIQNGQFVLPGCEELNRALLP